jgi:adenylate cyclase
MPLVIYVIDRKSVEADEGESILRVSLRAGIAHAHACGGNARCSTCRITVIEGLEHCTPRNEKEEQLASRLRFSPEMRLACQTAVVGDVKIRRLVLDEEDVELTDQLGAGKQPGAVGEEKQVAVLFSDIRGFTPFAEALPPYDVVHVLNRYFHEMGQAISRNGGRIDNYMGDGLMALFGMERAGGAAMDAVRAGLGMLEAMERFKPYLESIYSRSFEIGIGIHYGEVVVGAIGASSMKRVTAIGDAVNLASRIEAANKQAGTRLLVSEETFSEIKTEVRAGKSISAKLPGKSGEYVLYEITGLI